eukprot:scaffold7898_cov106-Skeletonema_dohrnii-CCMP3373.AAC.4
MDVPLLLLLRQIEAMWSNLENAPDKQVTWVTLEIGVLAVVFRASGEATFVWSGFRRKVVWHRPKKFLFLSNAVRQTLTSYVSKTGMLLNWELQPIIHLTSTSPGGKMNTLPPDAS